MYCIYLTVISFSLCRTLVYTTHVHALSDTVYHKYHVADRWQHVVVCSLLLVPTYQFGTPVLPPLAKFSAWGDKKPIKLYVKL